MERYSSNNPTRRGDQSSKIRRRGERVSFCLFGEFFCLAIRWIVSTEVMEFLLCWKKDGVEEEVAMVV